MVRGLIQLLTDPILQGPVFGSMLICLACALVGVLLVVKRRSLAGEALSHATYPGVVLGVLVAALFFPHYDRLIPLSILAGASVMAWLGASAIAKLERSKVSSDAALCFVLSSFFGLGVLIVSRVQITHAYWYSQIQVFLYGQVATMIFTHVVFYALLSSLVILMITLLYQPIRATLFDPQFARSVSINAKGIERLMRILLVVAIVVGIRSVGVVLMSGMLIAPACAARAFTHRLSRLFPLAGLFGLLSALLGNLFSVVFSEAISLPTGPLIVLSGSAIALLSLLLAPRRGVLFRAIRSRSFQKRCQLENVLKAIWKRRQATEQELKQALDLRVKSLLWQLHHGGWVERRGELITLTEDGERRAARIVRAHRLWEAYLVNELGQVREKVHKSAEEIEHVLTPELVERLSSLLGDPKRDPHGEEIPEGQT